ncbi:MAG: HU family DNA-binding protein [Prevotellaceae bacterium]|nr:HU family DNA-binding protein [Candidatus Faecinaster equi]
MDRKINQKDIVNELSARTGFYKKYLTVMMDALEEIIIENMNQATFDEPSEARLAFGFIVGAKRVPEHEGLDPRNGEKIVCSERLIPYAKFKSTFRDKINNIQGD